jgi:3-isopropylmalate dehydrogenase
MTTYRIALMPGDGVGPEVVAEGVKVLKAVVPRLEGLSLEFLELSVGAGEYLKSGDPLPPATLAEARICDAVLLGAMGLPSVRWPDGLEMTPQIDLREQLDLYFGVRPVKLHHPEDGPLRRPGEVDFVLIREQSEGLFAGRGGKVAPDAAEATDLMKVTRRASERLFRRSFELARTRRRRVTLVDKANVLPTMAFFRRIFDEVAREYPDVATERVYVDAMALYLIQKPSAFDVVVTENQFGDILSDLAAGLIGGMGMAPSADLGDRHGVFQPAHGSAPDIAGKGVANPIATILSAALLLDWLDDPEAKRGARLIDEAVARVLAVREARTRDLGGTMSTAAMGDRIVAELEKA